MKERDSDCATEHSIGDGDGTVSGAQYVRTIRADAPNDDMKTPSSLQPITVCLCSSTLTGAEGA